MAHIEGVDLVTEGIVTLSRVLELAQQYTSAESIPTYWDSRSDAATRIARYLLDQATDVRFFVGRAKNPLPTNPPSFTLIFPSK